MRRTPLALLLAIALPLAASAAVSSEPLEPTAERFEAHAGDDPDTDDVTALAFRPTAPGPRCARTDSGVGSSAPSSRFPPTVLARAPPAR